jgi:hypothetical protein
MKKIVLFILLVLSMTSINAQSIDVGEVYSHDESQWKFGSGSAHKFSMNYTLFGKSYANGLWQGGLGYATGMWLSGNKTGWGIAGSLIAVNLPILLDGDYNKGEIMTGKNLGALTVAIPLTFVIEINRKGKMTYTIPQLIRKRK